MITTIVRVSYLNAFEAKPNPSGKLKFSVSALIPKSDTQGVADIKKHIKAAVEAGIANNKFTAKQVSLLRLPLRDGDAEFEAGTRGPEYKGHWFFNASSDSAPGIVKAVKGSAPVPLFDQDELFSGCFCRLDVNFFPYNQAGNRGVGVGFNNLMLVRQGDRLDGRVAAEDAFGAFTSEDTDDNEHASEGLFADDSEDDVPFD